MPKIYGILFWPDKAHYLFNVLLQEQTCVGCNTHNSVPSQNRQKCASIDFNSSYHSIMYNLPTDIIDERFLKSVQKKNKEGHKKLSNNSSVAQQKFWRIYLSNSYIITSPLFGFFKVNKIMPVINLNLRDELNRWSGQAFSLKSQHC